jgi:hypothetical protein
MRRVGPGPAWPEAGERHEKADPGDVHSSRERALSAKSVLG